MKKKIQISDLVQGVEIASNNCFQNQKKTQRTGGGAIVHIQETL
jgi:hypothetical protein